MGTVGNESDSRKKGGQHRFPTPRVSGAVACIEQIAALGDPSGLYDPTELRKEPE